MKSRLTVKKIQAISLPGYYSDGDNLYLQVSRSKTKSWLFIYRVQGKKHELGLGRFGMDDESVSLDDAREKAGDLRKKLRHGVDPITEKRKAKKESTPTFQLCASNYIDAHKSAWKNPKHIQQWQNTLSTYAYPFIGDELVSVIDTAMIERVLKPIWSSKNETASRLRGRIEKVMDFATVQGYRHGDNPARWRGHLDVLLSSPGKIQKTKHHKALPWQEMPGLIAKLRHNGSLSALALEFLILTAARTGEVIGSKWCEIDLTEKTWTIPGERMKAEREHRVPLTDRAMTILKTVEQQRVGDYVFPGRAGGLSNAAMDKILQVTLGYDCTVHGMRSAFRDWASETTHHSNEVCEMALAHVIKNKAESAYRRGDLLDKRRLLLTDWQVYLENGAENGR